MSPDPKRDALPSSPESIEALSRITPEHVEEAREWWRRAAPPRARDYFDAEPTETNRATPVREQGLTS